MRALISYQQAKFKRVRKIKSKKYVEIRQSLENQNEF
jgi:U3 small nucleolar RNA-associated protein 14